MKTWKYLLLPLALAGAAPVWASPAETGKAPAATPAKPDAESISEGTRRSPAQLREALEARKQANKDAAARGEHGAEGPCTDCPDKIAARHHHSASEERKVDAPECIERAHYA